MLIAIIVACEIGFWVVLAAGLLARYPLRLRRTGAALLLCVPLVDLVLLAATVIDLRNGAAAEVVRRRGGGALAAAVTVARAGAARRGRAPGRARPRPAVRVRC